MPAQLVALDGGPNILLDKPILLVGRHAECDIQIDSRKISRRHCCIAQVGHHLIIRDLGSTNGIRINGVRVLEGRLNEGDELTLGHSVYKVSWNPVTSKPRPKPSSQGVSPSPSPGPRNLELEDDDLLESCEDPIPLADSDAPPRNAPPPRAKNPSPSSGKAPPPSMKPSEEKSIPIPDPMNRPPSSSIFPLLPPEPSKSHPPM